MATIISDRRLYEDAEGIIVEHGDPRGVRLLVGAGCETRDDRLITYLLGSTGLRAVEDDEEEGDAPALVFGGTKGTKATRGTKGTKATRGTQGAEGPEEGANPPTPGE